MFSAHIPEHFIAIKGEDTGRLKSKTNKTTIPSPSSILFAYELTKASCCTRGIQMLKDTDTSVDKIQNPSELEERIYQQSFGCKSLSADLDIKCAQLPECLDIGGKPPRGSWHPYGICGWI